MTAETHGQEVSWWINGVHLESGLYQKLFKITNSHSHSPTKGGGCHSRWQQAHQENQCLSQGHFRRTSTAAGQTGNYYYNYSTTRRPLYVQKHAASIYLFYFRTFTVIYRLIIDTDLSTSSWYHWLLCWGGYVIKLKPNLMCSNQI